MKSFVMIGLLFGVSLLARAESIAESKPDTIVPHLEMYDTDSDGYISADEAERQKMPSKTFETLDVDRDGRLNKDEFSTMPPLEID